ncbi:hypothetical protein [Paenibacillus xylanexedens]|uniref:hypothetical protein n=1 Tax=Paenibacillus xylanexedens TaxID=528191 RepID=UPI0011A84605|nr:hypothetical protein [Paenibacillus xylanexedens]
MREFEDDERVMVMVVEVGVLMKRRFEGIHVSNECLGFVVVVGKMRRGDVDVKVVNEVLV